jgi:ribose transport system substrate-binding protein
MELSSLFAMPALSKTSYNSMRFARTFMVLALSFNLLACGHRPPRPIAVIPRTSGTILWEPENVGAQTAASELGERIYWNASSREDDIDGQVALVEKVAAGGYKGLVLSPDHSLALITPVRRALAGGLPIVIVGSPLPIPPGGELCYVLNDEAEGGRIAAHRAAAIIEGRGKVALTGMDPDIAGVITRASSFEQLLATSYPEIQVVTRRNGILNYAHEQKEAEKLLKEFPDVKVIVALTSTATRGAVSAIGSSHLDKTVKVIGFEPDSLPFENVSLDSLIVQNTRAMGDRAIRLIHARVEGKPFPPTTTFEPLLVTRENVNSKMVQEMVYARWQPGPSQMKRIFAP